jgi:hypothetical protein
VGSKEITPNKNRKVGSTFSLWFENQFDRDQGCLLCLPACLLACSAWEVLGVFTFGLVDGLDGVGCDTRRKAGGIGLGR